jgi:hypothetical protein
MGIASAGRAARNLGRPRSLGLHASVGRAAIPGHLQASLTFGGISCAILLLSELGIVLTSGAVSTWTDQTGLGHSVTQGTAASRPTIVADQANGFSAVRNDGTDDWLKAATFTLNQPTFVHITYKSRSYGAININDAVFDGDGPSSMFLVSCSNAGLRTIITAGTSLAYDVNVCNAVFDDLLCQFNGVSSAIYVRGAQKVAGDAGAGNAAGFTLGASGANIRWTPTDVAEVCVYSGIASAAVIARLHRNSEARYAL